MRKADVINFRTRKYQIMDFIRKAKLPLKTKAEKTRFREAMRDACMVGACEERSRNLKIICEYIPVPMRTKTIDEIIKKPVLKVLGFEKGGE
jgi:hypothetical protein